jgi:hypothetical protein
MRICSVCSAENIDSAERCQRCGAWLTTEPVADRTVPPRDRIGGMELPPSDTLDGRVLRLLQQGQKIPAIKLYREETGTGLKEAKDAVEMLGRQYGMKVDASGCGAAVLVACLTIAAAVYVVHSLVAG